jgi:putative chitinase
MITAAQVKLVAPGNKDPETLAQAFNAVLPKYAIDSTNRVAGFLAQCGHESLDFTVLHENVNYSADRLHQVFPKYFPTAASAQAYNRQPEKIANKVYGGRLGNGPEGSGDGWKFRGRGAIQLTGRDNYQKFADSIGKTLDDAVAYCETLEGAVESACWFWRTHDLNAYCDKDDIVGMSKRVNGGNVGLEDRKARYAKAKKALGE